MDALLLDVLFEFRRHKSLADRAMASLDDGDFFARPAPHVNPIAVIVIAAVKVRGDEAIQYALLDGRLGGREDGESINVSRFLPGEEVGDGRVNIGL